MAYNIIMVWSTIKGYLNGLDHFSFWFKTNLE